MIAKNIPNYFNAVFNTETTPVIVRSPGRVNIIGEHTDYNEGFVLPAAIDKAIYVAATARTDSQVHLYSHEYDLYRQFDLQDLKPVPEGWPNYILGVCDQLQKRRYNISGFNLILDGDIPLGAGLSSSAAVACATVFALNDLFELNIQRSEMIRIAQKAEHVFAGVMCGIMDQFASMFGRKDHAIKLDCKTLEHQYIPLNMEGTKIVLFNTHVSHSLSSSEYNTRRQQCEQGVKWVKETYPAVNSLRNVYRRMLDEVVKNRDELIYKRCSYVIEENDRLREACEDLKKGDLVSLGKKMFLTHEGLSKEYEVSCPELDLLVEAVKENQNVLGARMMGGGFGGCTINLVKENAIESLVEEVARKYKAATGLDLSAYITQIENGTERLSQHTHANVYYNIYTGMFKQK